MSADERIQIASSFLLQSPPGEINDVLNDVRAIIEDDEALQTGILPALLEYNITQFTTVDVPGHDHQVIISQAGQLPGDNPRFVDPRSKTSFVFDHLRLEATDPQPYEPDADAEPFREALERALLAYVSDHFHEGVASVFARPTSSGSGSEFVLQLVSNKYNPPNFWSGRWRSEYILDFANKDSEDGGPIIVGNILVTVHYYEQGNVQLATTHAPSIAVPVAARSQSDLATASKIVALIQREESAHQSGLSATFSDMAEKSFRSLRRALPLTKQKMDWDRVAGYKLGAELTASGGIFGAA
ncbi:F-actin capping protein, alpha subunit [Auriculariales sp. MPI-PUGE-AT-0066]|nr:F-actin capping protein, alpha subunit [Auriculariales sp. MPI-PUGE-AT-0066]